MRGINVIISKRNSRLKTVILIHGDIQNHTSLNFISKLIKSKGHSVLSFDLPGHGLSKFSEDTTDLIQILKTIIKQNQIENPIIIAHSIGTAIASIYAKENDVSALVLINPLISNIKVVNPAINQDEMIKEYMQCSKAFFKEQKLVDFSENKSPEEFQKIGFETTDPRGLMNNIEFLKALPSQDDIQNINAPILIIASEDDALTPIQYPKELQQKAKSAKLEIIKGGHNTVLKNPQGIIDAINKNYQFLIGQ